MTIDGSSRRGVEPPPAAAPRPPAGGPPSLPAPPGPARPIKPSPLSRGSRAKVCPDVAKPATKRARCSRSTEGVASVLAGRSLGGAAPDPARSAPGRRLRLPDRRTAATRSTARRSPTSSPAPSRATASSPSRAATPTSSEAIADRDGGGPQGGRPALTAVGQLSADRARGQLLLEMARSVRGSAACTASPLDLPMSRTDIGDYLGMRVEHGEPRLHAGATAGSGRRAPYASRRRARRARRRSAALVAEARSSGPAPCRLRTD